MRESAVKICRFNHGRLGVVEGNVIKDVTAALAYLPELLWPLDHGDHVVRNLSRLMPHMRAEAARQDALTLRIEDVRLASPVANPSKIVAAPLNYPLHVKEGSDPAINHGVHMPNYDGFATPIDKFGLFLKSPTGLVGASDGIEIHFPDRRNDHEAELAVVIGQSGKRISHADALKHVAAYSIALDMTVRGPEDRSFRKSADSYSVLGPWLVTADEIADPNNLEFYLTVNGELRQKANTSQLICDIPDLIARASAVYELFPGDIIMTGTPDGVAEVVRGDRIQVWFEAIGEMKVLVR
jgi:2-keto-4-pentenoate hydratase/2-oxohepta-3-ene-1,7-dioic acid hydratase in catechol pathway